jgi:hypothetical protein
MSEAELERALLMLWGATRWDGRIVARALRSGGLSESRLFPEALARLFDESHPQGLGLVLRGQGSAATLEETAERYDRLVAVGSS